LIGKERVDIGVKNAKLGVPFFFKDMLRLLNETTSHSKLELLG
jgi:hypothetical protein